MSRPAMSAIDVAAPDDDVQITGVAINKSTDIDFWGQQSAREMRSQLNLRNPTKKGDWAFKGRQDLIKLIGQMIKDKTW